MIRIHSRTIAPPNPARMHTSSLRYQVARALRGGEASERAAEALAIVADEGLATVQDFDPPLPPPVPRWQGPPAPRGILVPRPQATDPPLSLLGSHPGVPPPGKKFHVEQPRVTRRGFLGALGGLLASKWVPSPVVAAVAPVAAGGWVSVDGYRGVPAPLDMEIGRLERFRFIPAGPRGGKSDYYPIPSIKSAEKRGPRPAWWENSGTKGIK
jgi:hypothetical protein